MRALSLGALATVFSIAGSSAPLQCGSKHGPDVHTEETGDTLWALAMDFKAKGNEDAAKQTLKVLVEKYPSNRHVPAAKAELAGASSSSSPPVATSDGGT